MIYNIPTGSAMKYSSSMYLCSGIEASDMIIILSHPAADVNMIAESKGNI
jgi:hypothetical protein